MEVLMVTGFLCLTLLATPANSQGVVCHSSILKTCRVENFQYVPGDLRHWRDSDGLSLNSTYWSNDPEESNHTFSFNSGTVQLSRRARIHSEECFSKGPPLVFMYRMSVNAYHFVADQLATYAWALRDYGLDMDRTQLVALNGHVYQDNSKTKTLFHSISNSWRIFSGTEPVDWEQQLDRPLCAKVAFFTEPVFGEWWSGLRPQDSVASLRKDFDWFIQWVLRKLDLQYSPKGSVPRVTVVDRSGSGYRRLENNAEVVQYLASRGWAVTVVQIEKLNFEEQVSLMTKTDVLLAAHGAALVNIFFLPPWAVAVELCPYGFGAKNYLFYPGFCNLARTSERSLIKWHDQVERERPPDYSGDQEWKDLDIYLTEADQQMLFENVTALLKIPAPMRNFDECIMLNAPAT